jgi:hypothetical protein
MSSASAIAAVTVVLKELLNNAFINHDLSADLGQIAVTSLPPEVISVNKADDQSQLNLFLYLVTPNSSWRNAELPSYTGSGERMSNPPLALDLHYLLTAYSSHELHGELLLGYAMQLLHETPVLTRATIRSTLQPALPAGVSLPPGYAKLSISDLAEQVEAIKVCPHYLSIDEMSKVWSTIQRPYRPTMAYQVSVVLIQETRPVRSSLPVLRRGKEDGGVSVQPHLIPPYPTVEKIDLPRRQVSALSTDALTIKGHHFTEDADGPLAIDTMTVRLVHPHRADPVDLDVPRGNYTNTQITVSLRDGEEQCPPGVCAVSILIALQGPSNEMRSSNEFPLSIAPRIETVNSLPLQSADELPVVQLQRADPENELGDLVLDLTCAASVLPGQRVALLLGSRMIPAEPHPQPTHALRFIAHNMSAGTFWLRLRVDGVDSLLIDRSDKRQPIFDETQQVILQ